MISVCTHNYPSMPYEGGDMCVNDYLSMPNEDVNVWVNIWREPDKFGQASPNLGSFGLVCFCTPRSRSLKLEKNLIKTSSNNENVAATLFLKIFV